MATTTFEVSTWEELVSAIQASITAGDTHNILLTADIDCNYSVPLGVSSTIYFGYSSDQYTWANKIVDGQGHIIRNLRTSITSPTPIFSILRPYYGRTRAYWKNIDFINLCLDSYLFVWGENGQGSSPGYYYMNFENCRFVGRRSTRLMKASHTSASTDISGCFFNVYYIPKVLSTNGSNNSYMQNDYSDSTITAQFCWFHETYNGWATSSTVASCYDFRMNGCYVDGTIRAQETTSSGNKTSTFNINVNNTAGAYTPTIQNVIDCILSCDSIDSTAASNTITVKPPNGLLKNYILRNGSSTPVNYDSITNTATIVATPAQMEDAQALYDLGFDIIVPET